MAIVAIVAIKYIKLIDKKDTIGDGKWIECRTKRHFTKGGCTNLKALNSRGRKRCFICGHREGSWQNILEMGIGNTIFCVKNVERI